MRSAELRLPDSLHSQIPSEPRPRRISPPLSVGHPDPFRQTPSAEPVQAPALDSPPPAVGRSEAGLGVRWHGLPLVLAAAIAPTTWPTGARSSDSHAHSPPGDRESSPGAPGFMANSSDSASPSRTPSLVKFFQRRHVAASQTCRTLLVNDLRDLIPLINPSTV